MLTNPHSAGNVVGSLLDGVGGASSKGGDGNGLATPLSPQRRKNLTTMAGEGGGKGKMSLGSPRTTTAGKKEGEGDEWGAAW